MSGQRSVSADPASLPQAGSTVSAELTPATAGSAIPPQAMVINTTDLTPFQRVLNTVELLEGILLALTTRDYGGRGVRTLLASQYVNRRFRTTITESPSIRRALFCEKTQAFYPTIEIRLGKSPACVLGVHYRVYGSQVRFRLDTSERSTWTEVEALITTGSWSSLMLFKPGHIVREIELWCNRRLLKFTPYVHGEMVASTLGEMLDAAVAQLKEPSFLCM